MPTKLHLVFRYSFFALSIALIFECGSAYAINDAAHKQAAPDNILFNRALDAASIIKLLPPGTMPLYGDGECARLLRLAPPERLPTGSDAMAIANLIASTNGPHARKLASVLPATFLWYMRVYATISYTSLPTSMHETNHALNETLSACNKGQRVYYFNGVAWPTEIRLGDSPNASVAAAFVPKRFHDTSPLSRYSKYLVQSAANANDFVALMEELNAYLGASILEVELVKSQLHADFRKSGVTMYDGNIGGIVDLMLFSLAYLKFVEENPATFPKLKTSPLFRAHFQRLWTQSEGVICAVAPYTKEAGGILAVSYDKLESIYSDEFISTLDRLNIKHMTGTQVKKCRPQKP